MDKYREYRTNAPKGAHNDCTIVALGLLCNIPYLDAFAAGELVGRKYNHGLTVPAVLKMFEILDTPLCKIDDDRLYNDNGNRLTCRSVGRYFGDGRYLVLLRAHALALIDGQVEDWTKGRCHRIESMYRIGA